MSENLLPYQPSLGSATGTRVDSACKHHHQCRVSTDDMMMLTVPQNNSRELQNNKYRFCIHKDELVLGIGRPWSKSLAKRHVNNAYPRVISNLGMYDGKDPASELFRKMIVYMYHYCRGARDRELIIKLFENGPTIENDVLPNGPNSYFNFAPQQLEKMRDALRHLYDMSPMGYAQTLGYAHPANGDTMTTVMIGGLRTVMNGDFEVHTNDVIQWYWPFELNCFKPNGMRKRIGGPLIFDPAANGGAGAWQHCNIDPTKEWEFVNNVHPFRQFPKMNDSEAREELHTKVYGMQAGEDKIVPRIKPYFEDDVNFRMYDQMRVFAVAVGCARPHEYVDIKICRQAM